MAYVIQSHRSSKLYKLNSKACILILSACNLVFLSKQVHGLLSSKPANTFNPSCTLTRCNQFCAGRINKRCKLVLSYVL
ncbi:hypothetical protein Nmel_004290 [Mimus melanotis]